MSDHQVKGHNSGDDVLSSHAAGQLRSLMERLQRLASQKADLAEDIKEVFAEAKGVGFDTKIIRKVLRLLAMDPAKLEEEEALVDLYKHAVTSGPAFTPAGSTADEDEDDIG